MKYTSNRHGKALVALLGLAVLGGCANQNLQATLSSSAEFNACSESIWSAAEQTDTTAKYYSVAQQAQSCLRYAPVSDQPDSYEQGTHQRAANSDEITPVLRLHALSVTNYLVAGELGQARKAFETFTQTFPHSDLQLADGSSFVDSMNLLFDASSSAQASNNSLLNASAPLKAELRRQHYWVVN